jgi:hypothetical protein
MYFIKIFGVIAALGLSSFFILKYFLDEMFTTGGIYLNTTVSIATFIVLSMVYLFFALASFKTASKGIHRHF